MAVLQIQRPKRTVYERGIYLKRAIAIETLPELRKKPRQ